MKLNYLNDSTFFSKTTRQGQAFAVSSGTLPLPRSEDYLVHAETDKAIGVVFLKGMFNGIRTSIDIELEKIREERKSRKNLK